MSIRSSPTVQQLFAKITGLLLIVETAFMKAVPGVWESCSPVDSKGEAFGGNGQSP